MGQRYDEPLEFGYDLDCNPGVRVAAARAPSSQVVSFFLGHPESFGAARMNARAERGVQKVVEILGTESAFPLERIEDAILHRQADIAPQCVQTPVATG